MTVTVMADTRLGNYRAQLKLSRNGYAAAIAAVFDNEAAALAAMRSRMCLVHPAAANLPIERSAGMAIRNSVSASSLWI